ncbi:M20 metallopeptidase family protein [Pseudonocardia oroxyli]|uniref:Hippurate hydrolase n=1 Tax=Pseudonocardia oroxyli TaxID=366584 RepID=A0A1G7UWU6_PSEOR|nr:M20 family metallopeptidase [Pseudonocardia oroxyli]SDG52075.1 hippurate hydrolase [Pseudonocardia oroxyli]
MPDLQRALPSSPAALLGAARALQPRTVAFRRALHRQPELGLRLPHTRDLLIAELADLPLTLHRGRDLTSVVAVLDGARRGRTTLLRADMDALPVQEGAGVAFASEVPGRMHACGHDLHVAMLAGAARLLCERREEISGRVVLMFQPGEEGFHGARHMIDEGLLARHGPGGRPDAAFALHVSATMPTGELHLRPGPIMAAADVLRVTVTGRGGHASAPHHAVDPVPAAAAMVGALQTMITRKVDAHDPTVLTVSRITAGTTDNVIPETAELEGTLRTMAEPVRRAVCREIERVCTHTALAHDCTAQVAIEPGYPVTVNDPAATARLADTGRRLLGDTRVHTMPTPIMGAEDFAYVLQKVPGALAFLGACPPGTAPHEAAPNHSARVRFDESAMPAGVALYAALAMG